MNLQEIIFSIKINEETKHKIITILGFKFKFKHINPMFKNLLKKNVELKNKAEKKRCFILATGPSVNNQDLSLLKGEDCFSTSNFFLHELIQDVKPKFHFLVPYHKPLILENYIEWLKMADEKLPANTNIVLATVTEPMVEKYNLFKNRKVYYVNFGNFNLDKDEINIDITKTIMSPQTGPIMILPFCAYMGYEEIYLVGQDMNRLASYGGTTQNFYKNDPRVNATDKNNWIDIIPELERTLVMFKQFKRYADYFKKCGIKFYNLSPTSWLSFIEKKDYEKLLKK